MTQATVPKALMEDLGCQVRGSPSNLIVDWNRIYSERVPQPRRHLGQVMTCRGEGGWRSPGRSDEPWPPSLDAGGTHGPGCDSH